MAYTYLTSFAWGSAPQINIEYDYDMSRSGKDMLYSFQVTLGAILGYSSFGYNIGLQIYLNNSTTASYNELLKQNSPSQWQLSTYQIQNLRVSNKTSGTVHAKFVLTTNSTGRSSYTFETDLPIIPAKSTITATSATVGNVSTITINKGNSSYTSTLQWKTGNDSYTTIVTKTNATSYDWTLPTSLYSKIGAANKSITVTINCITYDSAGTNLGSSTTTLKASCDESTCKPTATLSLTVNNPQASLTGSANKIIKNYSNVTATATVQAKNSATISSYNIVNSGVSATTTPYTFTEVTDGLFTLSVVDSRGFSNVATQQLTIVNYVKPTIVLELPVITTAGVTSLKVSGAWFNGSFGSANNSRTIQFRYKQSGGSYGSWVNFSTTPTLSGNTYNATSQSISGLDYTKQYTFQCRLVDSLNTATSAEITAQSKPVFDWGNNDFNFNVPVSFPNASISKEGYVKGTWLQTTATSDLGSSPTRYPVLDSSGWIYSRTPKETRSDLGIYKMVFGVVTLSYSSTSATGTETDVTVSGLRNVKFASACQCFDTANVLFRRGSDGYPKYTTNSDGTLTLTMVVPKMTSSGTRDTSYIIIGEEA